MKTAFVCRPDDVRPCLQWKGEDYKKFLKEAKYYVRFERGKITKGKHNKKEDTLSFQFTNLYDREETIILNKGNWIVIDYSEDLYSYPGRIVVYNEKDFKDSFYLATRD